MAWALVGTWQQHEAFAGEREDSMKRVDVIVPCYNYGRYLNECVRSILSQEGVDVRVLIIDDASPDDSAEVAARLAAADSRVEARRHATNQGHIATYNEGLEWGTADYTLLLAADDMLTPGSLPRSVRPLEAHPEVGFTHGRTVKTSDPERDRARPPGDYGCRITGPQVLPGDLRDQRERGRDADGR